ncbi:M28 family peptidase [Croceivirga thetidis]|uniref:M28 family peptidase n=1 Tax=Croceivirga thetidis TaxID=2721623 RepID=A0ABX1GQD9_9FLAO|nr:M28 family peptidase [Croceivirga thetidis]NKI31251.1 M28 family peptidase [Croceivirga thetidis]
MRLFFFLLVAAILCINCKTKETFQFSLEETVNFLASDSLKGRATGTLEEQQAAAFLANQLKELGFAPKGVEETYLQTFTFMETRDPHKEVEFITAGEGTTTGTNVIGFYDKKAEKTIVLGAHYDHLGMGGQGSLHRGDPEIHNGADDNASGVATVLKIAEKLKDSLMSTNILVQFYSGEEMGLLGSNYYVKNPTLEMNEINFMINLDMVGRLREDKSLSISGVGTSSRWNQSLNVNNPGFKLILKESGIGPSDHTSFYLADIPVLHFFTGQHEDYHRPSDDSEKLNYEGMNEIADYIVAVCMDLDNSPKLTFKMTKNESEEVPRFKVGLGVVPDYLFDGKGMRIDGVSENKPAQKAGLQKGDVVVQLGDSLITDMMSYMRTLSTFEKGDATKAVVDRNGEKIEVDIEF